jgi:hypothetical protein
MRAPADTGTVRGPATGAQVTVRISRFFISFPIQESKYL